jgi:hypothetical protein
MSVVHRGLAGHCILPLVFCGLVRRYPAGASAVNRD